MLGKIEIALEPSLPTGGGEVTSGGESKKLFNMTKKFSRVVTSTYKKALHACKRAGIATQECDDEVVVQRSIREEVILQRKIRYQRKMRDSLLRILHLPQSRRFILRLRGEQIPNGSMISGRRKGIQQEYGYRIQTELVPKTK